MDEIKYLTAGDSAIVVEFGNRIDEEINQKVRMLADLLEREKVSGIVDTLPTFRSLMVCFDPALIDRENLLALLKRKSGALSGNGNSVKRVIEIPVCYGARFGADLKDVAAHSGLTYDEVIALHSGRDYRIYMLGFLPGFSYLGGMDEKLATPRLSNPRVKIPAGSVGIGGEQTGIYPLDSPGGWRLIGATPVRTYDPEREEPILFAAGDYLRFVPVSLFDYYDIRRMVDRGEYYCRVYENGKECPGRLAGVDLDKKDVIIIDLVSGHSGERQDAGTSAGTMKILMPGFLTTVQDFGRVGYQKYGFTVCGVMDRVSYALANELVGNPAGAAVLECTMAGPTVIMQADTKIAVTGADMKPLLNGQPIPMNEAVLVKQGDTVALGVAETGCRAYLAAAGGINVPLQMGSRSTNMKCRIGGYQGRKLTAGDVLPLGEERRLTDMSQELSAAQEKLKSQPSGETYNGGAGSTKPEKQNAEQRVRQLLEESLAAVRASAKKEVLLHVIPGPQEEYFTPQGISNFYQNSYTLTGDCDRMGYKLEGAAVEAVNGADIISDGIAFGAVQIPPNGKPIIMLADRQTTGGYAKIGTVAEADLPKLAQLRPGKVIRFVKQF